MAYSQMVSAILCLYNRRDLCTSYYPASDWLLPWLFRTEVAVQLGATDARRTAPAAGNAGSRTTGHADSHRTLHNRRVPLQDTVALHEGLLDDEADAGSWSAGAVLSDSLFFIVTIRIIISTLLKNCLFVAIE